MKDDCYDWKSYRIYTYDSVDSTNSVAKRAVELAGADMDRSVHVAGEQTNGKGRRGRKWLNTDEAVMMSIVVRTKLQMDRVPLLNLAAAVAVRNAVLKLTEGQVGLSIKWPNDLVVTDRFEKVCGILSEAVIKDKAKYAVIGIGLNLNAETVPDGLLQPASSVFIQCRRYVKVLDAVNAIVEEFDSQYRLLQKDIPEFIRDYASQCVSLGRHVKVDFGGNVRYGVGDKLSPSGQLIVKYEDGETDEVNCADVSIRNLERTDERLAAELLPRRRPDANKGSFGRALLIVGSDVMPGAALMCTKACIRTGAGLTKVLIPESIKPSFALIPEAMLETDDEKADELIKWASVIGIGCGLGISPRTRKLIEAVLLSKKPCVLDADALNTLSRNKTILELLHENAVITPHPAEMARLIGEKTEKVLKCFTNTALAFAEEYGCNVLLKSASSVLASPDGRVRYNDSGSSALAKGGSGDVLTGIITAFIAQGAAPFDAASLGAYLLGVSAEKAIDFLHNRFVCAGDVIDIISSEINERS